MPNPVNVSRSPAAPEQGVKAARDIVGLQALAASAVARANAGPSQDTTAPDAAGEEGVARRGPFRPEVWLNARQRNAVRLVGHYFRIIDIVAIACVSLACIWVAEPGSVFDSTLAGALPFAIGATMALGLMRSLGLYRFRQGQTLAKHSAAVVCIALVSGAVALMAGWVLDGATAILGWIGLWTAATATALVGLHLLWWTTLARWRANGVFTPNVVVVGATRHAERLIKDALKRRDINVLGVFDDRLARSPDSVQGVPVLGRADALLTHRMTPYVDRIVLAIDPHAQARVRELSSRLSTLPNEVMLLVDPQGDEECYAALEKLSRTPLASLDGPTDPDRRAFNKRLQDIVVGALALVLLSPVIALTALAVRLDSPGPIFFRQRRHGFNQEEIVVWKFRSMRQETADATASRQVTADDDRVTKVGKILRSPRLDELPQLLNVLKGEMSLVGPRPHAIGMKTGDVESARLVAEYAHRHRIKPGMTGWAAIHGSR
ncbi:MAG: Undecaprenyl-phosphate glucose phosphotransferase, partial [Brevundimonas sp.]|nr:Undecaprenyl-phosphate glucose phosphotransferase [Brevundimonas sp.]